MASEHLYRDSYRSIHRLLLALSGSWVLAEDLTQEAFLDLIRRGTGGIHDVKRYLTRIAIRRWQYHVACTARRPVPLSLADDVPCNAPEGEYGLDRQQELRQVNECLQSLPADERTALVLISMMGYTAVEASEILGLPRTTLVSQHRRATERLRWRLRKAAI